MLAAHRVRSIALAVVLVATTACGSETSAPATVCAAGVSIACIGPGGCAGGQACKADGSGYDACDCGGGAVDSAIADADAPADIALDSLPAPTDTLTADTLKVDSSPPPDTTAPDTATADTLGRKTYSATFTSGVAGGTGTSQCTSWTAFRASLATEPGSYTKVTLSGSKDPVGIACTTADAADLICRSLATGATSNVPCDGRTWRVGNCGPPNFEVTATSSGVCGCDPVGYSIRPCHPTADWGGIDTATCAPPTQTMTITCE